eukprot:gene5846-6436_t
MAIDEEDMENSLTISTNWRPAGGLGLGVGGSNGNGLDSGFSQSNPTGMSTSQDGEICTQRDPPGEDAMATAMIRDVTEQPPEPPRPIPWARLICKSAELPSYEFSSLPPDEEGRHNLYLIGRGGNCNPRLTTSPRISNKHCLIYCKPNRADSENVYLEAWIEDLSANGTYLNKDIKLKRNVPRLLRTGDEIHFINPALVNMANYDVTAEDLIRNSFLVVIDLPAPPKSSNRTLRSQTIAKEIQIGRSNTVITLLSQNREFYDYYEMRELLGEGACGRVFLGIDKATGREWAVKVIDTRRLAQTNNMSIEAITKEAEMLRSLRHPNIIHLEDIFSQGAHLYMVMELSRGGDLFDRINAKRRYREEEAKQVMFQILKAIKYLHERNVAHRDLKPENILLVREDNDIELKLTDFGLAKVADEKQQLKSFCGTPQYFAPEVLERKSTILHQGRYTLAADMWSVGVILFVLLAGQYPFHDFRLEQQIATGQYSLDGPVWLAISEEAKDLIRHLLVVDPNQRYSAEEALNSAWLRPLVLELSEKSGTTVETITTVDSSEDITVKGPVEPSLMLPPPAVASPSSDPQQATVGSKKKGVKRSRSAMSTC